VINETLSKAFKTDSSFKLSGNTSVVDSLNKVDAIAVTYGPGLIGSLLVGVETAKTLSLCFAKPLIPVNHLVAHIYANWLLPDNQKPQFPALALVVSGGHTDLVLMRDHGKINWLGGTRDDAAGEAFDKSARLLGLPYPGGPSISVSAGHYLSNYPNRDLSLFPRPMISENNYDFSFSGLKTAVYNQVNSLDTNTKADETSHLSAELQEAICDVLVEKCTKAIAKFSPKSFLLAGGVSANKRLRKKFNISINKKYKKTKLYIPPIELCTDNASYIASCAFFNFQPKSWKNISANPSLTIED
jgi:N6-L-threonylcarbamoyladenine synthase